ncbi:MAG: SGNH/GDSL hydrolase family protein, partial [Dolichospermum sp.]|nr:SGNH/GDSL hydrolase family protein [Dolichospermum sp.]
PVGRDRNYPDHKPPLAIVEVLQRYAFKQQPIPEMHVLNNEGGDRVAIILDAIGNIKTLTQTHNCQLIIALTPLLRELGESGSRDYEIIARQRLSDFVKVNQITYLDFLPIFQTQSDPKSLYQDHIHVNSLGNKLVSQEVEKSLLGILN